MFFENGLRSLVGFPVFTYLAEDISSPFISYIAWLNLRSAIESGYIVST